MPKILRSVGRSGVNHPYDVALVQTAFSYNKSIDPLGAEPLWTGKVDGRVSRRFIAAIERFLSDQTSVHPDKIDPVSEPARALSLALPTEWQIPKELESREVDEEEADDGHGVLGSDDENPDRLFLTNPTGEGIRGQDRRGAGHFGAPRGSRRHTGVDFKGTPGQTVRAILGGKVIKYGYPYHGDMQRRYVMIEDSRGYVARHLYGHLEVPLDFGFRRLGALGSSVGCAFCSLILG